MRILHLLLVISSLLSTTTSFAAIIVESSPYKGNSGPFIYVMGPIEKGDDKHFSEIVGKRNISSAIVNINSPGGNVDASLEIGRIIRKKGYAVTVENDAQCASSCVLILAAGVDRIIYERAKVIIHRPYIDGALENDGGYDANYKRMVESLNKYCIEMNIPVDLVSRMITIPPHRAEELSEYELEKYLLSGKDPAYEQKEASNEAKKRGITVTELNKRKAVVEQICTIAYKGISPDNLVWFDHNAYLSCNEAILKGEPAETVSRRLTAVLEHKEQIVLLSDSAQDTCVEAVLFYGETKNCAIRW